MNRRLFVGKASGILAALGLCSKSNADVVDDANFKPPAPKTTVKITEIGISDYYLFDIDKRAWKISYEVHRDGCGVSRRTVFAVSPPGAFRDLEINLDLS